MDSKSSDVSIVEKVQNFCLGANIEEEFEAFVKEFQDTFTRTEVIEGEEHPMEFYNVYKEYLSRFESKIEAFIVREGFTVHDFYSECQSILENDDIYGTKRFFVEALLGEF